MSRPTSSIQVLLSLVFLLTASACHPADPQQGTYPTSNQEEQTPSPILPNTPPTEESTEEPYHLYHEDTFGLTLRLPSIWDQETSQSGMVNFTGNDGFLKIMTLSSGGMTLEEIALTEANHKVKPFGTDPQVSVVRIQGMLTYRISPSENQPEVNAGDPAWGMYLFHLPHPIQVDDSLADILILQADLPHLDEIASTLVLDDTFLDETRFPSGSDTPAAGICGQVEGDIVQVNISPDIMPSPRCLQLREEQLLSLVNQTGETLGINLAWYPFTLSAGEELILNVPLGAYLAPGVHDLLIEGTGSAPELWVLPPK